MLHSKTCTGLLNISRFSLRRYKATLLLASHLHSLNLCHALFLFLSSQPPFFLSRLLSPLCNTHVDAHMHPNSISWDIFAVRANQGSSDGPVYRMPIKRWSKVGFLRVSECVCVCLWQNSCTC